MIDIVLTLAGFVCLCAGVWLNWGAGWACIAGGAVMFLSGGLASRKVR